MSDLVAFLTARTDESEDFARNILEPASRLPNWVGERWLREVEAKRKILASHRVIEHPAQVGGLNRLWCLECDQAMFPCRTLRTLAAVYSDHPDYVNNWKVSK